LSSAQIVSDVWDYTVPNVAFLERTTTTPWKIYLAIIDLTNPGVSVKTLLSNGSLYGRQTTSGMAVRDGAVVAVNADFCSVNSSSYVYGVPQGITVLDGKIHVAPKYRTAIGFTKEHSATVGKWTDRWNWYGRVREEQGQEHDIVMMNLDVNTDWLCMFTDKYGRNTPGSTLSSSVVEVVVGADSLVTELRSDQLGVSVPVGGYVLTGREGSATWLTTHVSVGEKLAINYATIPDWRNLWQAVSGGPRFVKDGAYYADPKAVFPAGEDFAQSYKDSYYTTRQPRSAAGITVNGDTLVLVAVDGRQSGSVGMTLQELAELMIEFGVRDATQFDSGGSATMVFRGTTRNSPSDGTERPIANALGIMSTTRYLNVAPWGQILSASGELAGYEASKLIDGLRHRGSGKWVSTDPGLHWVEIDLGEVRPLTHLRLFGPQSEGDPSYLNAQQFSVSTRIDTVSPWSLDFDIANDTTWQQRDNVMEYGSARDVRYLRLEITKATYVDYENHVRLSELAVYIADTTVSSLGDQTEDVPSSFVLEQNYPNPFNPETVIRYTLPEPSIVRLEIHDLLGRKVATLVNDKQDRGEHILRWRATSVASGVYFSVVEIRGLASGQVQTAARRMLLMR
jgi:hypothetical protein